MVANKLSAIETGLLITILTYVTWKDKKNNHNSRIFRTYFSFRKKNHENKCFLKLIIFHCNMQYSEHKILLCHGYSVGVLLAHLS